VGWQLGERLEMGEAGATLRYVSMDIDLDGVGIGMIYRDAWTDDWVCRPTYGMVTTTRPTIESACEWLIAKHKEAGAR
jgi:hypothetical protein